MMCDFNLYWYQTIPINKKVKIKIMLLHRLLELSLMEISNDR